MFFGQGKKLKQKAISNIEDKLKTYAKNNKLENVLKEMKNPKK